MRTARWSFPDRVRAAAWITLLTVAQAADLLTTQVAMSHGAVEGNLVSASVLAWGGIWLLTAVKAALVLAMALAVWLVLRRRDDGSRRGAVATDLVWRGLQLCVLVLVVTAVHNLSVIQDVAGA